MGGKLSSTNSKKNKYTTDLSKLSKEYFSLTHKSIGFSSLSQKDLKISLKNIYSKKYYVKKSNDTNFYSYGNNQKTIFWKKYLLSVLAKKREKGIQWATNLFHRIQEEMFFEEKIFTSEAVYHEFSLNFIPKSIKDMNLEAPSTKYDPPELNMPINNVMNETNPIIEEDLEETLPVFSELNEENIISLVNTKEKKKNDGYGNNLIYQPNLVLGGREKDLGNKSNAQLIFQDPIFDGRNTSLLSADSNHFQNDLKEIYFIIFKIIREHLSKKEHPINLVIKMFREEISKEIKMHPINKIQDENTKMNSFNYLIKQIQSFLMHLQIALKLFYFKTFNFDSFNEEHDDILNLVTTLLFSNSDFYTLIFDLYLKAHEQKIEELKTKFNLFGNITPYDSGTEDKFCLDDRAIKAMIKFLEKNEHNWDKRNELKTKLQKKLESQGQASNNNKQELINSSANNLKIDYSFENLKSNNDPSKRVTSKISNKVFNDSSLDNLRIEENVPYKSTLKILQELNNIHSPYQKMIQLIKIGKEIRTEVHSFWNEIPLYMKKQEELSINTDNFLSIFNYLISYLGDPNIYIHYCLIEDFNGEYTKNSNIGYYHVILECSLKFLTSVDKIEKMRDTDKKKIMMNKKEMLYRSSLV